MPFTFSHPALILPLTGISKRWISITGLIIGSIVPDFEYFIRMKILSDYSHTNWGVLYFDLPLGLFLAFLFHNVIRDPFIDNLPLPLKQRLIPMRGFDWNRYFMKYPITVVLSIVAGTFSHLLWDGFTHENGFFVKYFSEMHTQFTVFGMQMYFYRILQHSSTVVGLFFIALTIARLPVQRYVTRHIDNQYWILAASITFVITALRIILGPRDFLYTQVIVTVIAAFIIALSITPSILRAFRQRMIA